MTVNQKVEALRVLLKKNHLKAYIINGTDAHNSEYVCSHFQSRSFISGFSGSYGIVLITEKDAFIWTDSRYFVQCEKEIGKTCFKMKKTDGPEAESFTGFLKKNFSGKDRIGISSETLMSEQYRQFRENGINVVPCEDFLDSIWSDRKELPSSRVEEVSELLSGESTQSKIERIRLKMNEEKVKYCIVSSLDDIAWILNLRADDVPNTPVFLSYLLIGLKQVYLFTSADRFDKKQLKNKCFKVLPYEEVFTKLSSLKNCRVHLNPKNTNMKIVSSLSCNDVFVVEGPDYSSEMKACKNETELNGMRIAHILDGAAIVNFMGIVRSNKYAFSELSIAKCLEDSRSEEETYLGPSFDTIAGFAEHGAIVHYCADGKSDREITGNGLLVLDSGAQYEFGTTDVTRTLLFGRATKEQKDNYTRVLKGHLAIASLVFPKGASGHQIDALAHQYLWQVGLDYFHGTGHGVGCRLSVHEGPQRISASKTASYELKPGMVVSDEPGVYKEGKFGIRIENLLAVVPAFKTDFGQFYTFEVLTCCPYERKLIDKSLLTAEEINLINTYHSWVYGQLKNLVNENGLKYLEEATKPL